MWQTTATALRAGGEALLIDSPYFPDELEALPGAARGGRLRARRPARHPRRLRPPARAARLPGPGARRWASRRWSGCVASRARPSGSCATTTPSTTSRGRRRSRSGQVQAPAGARAGSSWARSELELHPAEGHTADGTASSRRSLGVLVVGDYLSSVEIPMISGGGSLADYRATLARLSPLVEAAEVVVPGHGSPHDRATRAAAARRGPGLPGRAGAGRGAADACPPGRDTKAQRRIHAENLAFIRSS